jgi:probable rRNA maturation factor
VNVQVDLQLAADVAPDCIPGRSRFNVWANAACAPSTPASADHVERELTIRVVSEAEGADLNTRYRHKQGPTNVLSFPFEAPADVDMPCLGDIVICQPVVEREARDQHKLLEAHWAHLVVHGVLHLLGYDHLDDQQAEEMETLEIAILQQLGYPNPYLAPEYNERRTN